MSLDPTQNSKLKTQNSPHSSLPPLDPITTESFRQIDAELRDFDIALPPEQHPLVRRAIHSTADFELARLLAFHPDAIRSGLAALKMACAVITDVQMVAVGVDKRRLGLLGNRLACGLSDAETAAEAKQTGETRSAVGIRRALAEQGGPGPVVVIGNAPTALREVLRLIDAGTVRPALVIGVPVGFVDAAESKAALAERTDVPWITVVGRKGGSPVAVSLVNALLHLALPPGEF